MAARRWLGLVTQLTWLAGLEPSAARVDCRRAPARPDRSLDANAGTPSAAVAAPTLDVSAGSQQQQPSAAAAAGSYRAKARPAARAPAGVPAMRVADARPGAIIYRNLGVPSGTVNAAVGKVGRHWRLDDAEFYQRPAPLLLYPITNAPARYSRVPPGGGLFVRGKILRGCGFLISAGGSSKSLLRAA